MSRKAATNPPAPASRSQAPKRTAKTTAKPKKTTVYTVVRAIPSESPAFTDPDRVFATRAAARAHADRLNRELRSLLNPFDSFDADHLLTRGEKALSALVKKLRLPAPKKTRPYGSWYIDWEAWWDGHYFDMTDAQRDAVWDTLDNFDWYTVKATTLE